MDKRILPSPELLRQLLRYEPDTGRLYWKLRPRGMFRSDRTWRSWNAEFAEKEAFTTVNGGYYKGKIFCDAYLAHRVIWAMCMGAWPENQIDHKNGNKLDNRIENLRDADHTQNQRNQPRYRNNTSGIKGVSWHKVSGKWMAGIRVDGKRRHLGLFSSKEAARDAYITAAKRYHKEFANYG